MKMDALQLSEYIIRYAADQGKSVTNLKLQKTLYYVQGYALRCYPEVAFDDEIRPGENRRNFFFHTVEKAPHIRYNG